MPESLSGLNVFEWSGGIVAIITCISAIGALVKKYIITPLCKWIKSINVAVKELTPNGGSSIRDKIFQMDERSEKTKKLMEKNYARMMTIQDRMEMPIFECDPDGRLVYANKSLCELFGLERNSMLNNGWLAGIEAEDRAHVLDVWFNAVAKNIPYEATYKVINHKSRIAIACIASATPMVNSDGVVLGFHGTIESVHKVQKITP